MDAAEDLVTIPMGILKNLALVIDQEIGSVIAGRLKVELRELQCTFQRLLVVMEDAEKKLGQDKAIRRLLRRLKDAAFDVDDVFDELLCESILPAEKDSVIHKVQKLVSCSNLLVFRLNMAHKIKHINWKFEKIANDLELMLLHTTSTNSTAHDQNREHQIITTQHIESSQIVVGREKHKLEIVDMLLNAEISLSGNHNQNEKFLVIPIVGMAGLGKTTLAQLVYQDESVAKCFGLRIWLCVSNDFDVNRLLRDILEFISQTKCDDGFNDDVLLERLVHEKLNGKKYLIVLDDLWNENVEKWERFKSCLSVGAQGSKILINTCVDRVASIVGGLIPSFHLQQLSEDECWTILKQTAFYPGGALETPEMVELGKDIARKCGGSPLIAKFLGSHLYSKSDQNVWVSIKDNELWDIPEYCTLVIRKMKLIYNNLPSYLKICFSYFSIFPRNKKIHKESLIRVWMAEGCIERSHERNDVSMEDIGNEYFDSLFGCFSLFYDVEKDELGNIEKCRMHGPIHDLARLIAGDNMRLIIKVSDEMGNTSKVRRLRLVKALRDVADKQVSNFEESKIMFSNKHLRVLVMRNYQIRGLPDFSKLIHLRCLDLSNCKNIPSIQSISGPYHLQTLILRGCSSIRELPKDIGSLKHLRNLDLSYTMITVLPDSTTRLLNLRSLILNHCPLDGLATDFGALEHLRHLDVSATMVKKLPDTITRLYNLRMIKLDSCRNLEALPENFGALTDLRYLDITNTRILELPESITRCSYNLETLKLGHCELPKYIGNLKNLRHLIYEGEQKVTPRGIGRLTFLQTLQDYFVKEDDESEGSGIGYLEDLNLLQGKIKICNLQNVKSEKDAQRANLKGKENIHCLVLDWGLMSSRTTNDLMVLDALQPHPNLKRLKIKNFMGSKLPAWMGDSLSSCLPNLVELVLRNCKECTQLPALGQLQYLRVLYINGMNSVKLLGKELYGQESTTGEKAIVVVFPSLIELTLAFMPTLEDWVMPPPPPPTSLKLFSSFPLLEKMTVTFCHKLSIIGTPFPSLKELNLHSCGSLTGLLCIQRLTSLKRLTVRHCKSLKLSSSDMAFLFSTALLDIDTPITPF